MSTEAPELEFERTILRSSYSAISAHRECPARWHMRYVLRIKKPDFRPKPELHFGSWWGALTAAEGLERGRKLGSLVELEKPAKIQGPDDSPRFDARTVTAAEVFEAAKRWWVERDGETKDAFVSTLGEELPYRLRNLYRSWLERYADERKNERPLGFEIFVKRQLDIPHQVGDGEEHLEGVDLVGYLDEAFFDVERQMVVVRDRKSHKQLEARTALSDMMNSQLQLYAWIAQPLVASWGLGDPRLIGYDRARSVAPKTPVMTAAGGLAKNVTAFDLKTYREWSEQDTRPIAEIQDWLRRTEPVLIEDQETGEVTEFEPEIKATDDQIDYVRGLPPGRFYGELGSFLLSGVRKGNPKFGVYEQDPKVLERLAHPDETSMWFQRTKKPINLNVVKAHLQAAADTAMDAWRTEERVKRTGDPARNLGGACTYCDYADICRARMMGGARGEYDLAEFGLVAPGDAHFLINGRLENAPS